MLGLKLETDTRWAALAETNLPELMTDHAFCEQKAASNAISLIVQYPHLSELVSRLTEIAREELEHFGQVHAWILRKGWVLGRERKDPYVNDLLRFVRKGGADPLEPLLDRLLFAAMIEARSCERFKRLSETVQDPELARFYYDLMASEAGHYTTFIKLAKLYVPAEVVEARWEEFLAYEAEIIRNYGVRETIHG
jgi:tRNA-(ms[2]io[6]A)-hydroxylase